MEIKTSGGFRPGSGRPAGSQSPRNRMISAYIAALGGPDRITTIQRRDIERVVDLQSLAAKARAAALRGEVAIGDVTRLEVQLAGAIRRLNLPVPGGPSNVSKRYGRAEPVPTLQDYFANQVEDE